jgi:hypothetical protein
MGLARALAAGALATLFACGDLVAIERYGLAPQAKPIASPSEPELDASRHLTGLDASSVREASPSPTPSTDASSVPPCSTDYGDAVELVLRNERKDAVRLTMLDLPQQGCNEIWYGYLEPGTERKVDTEEGRVWRARKDDGTLIDEYWVSYNAQHTLVFEIK